VLRVNILFSFDEQMPAVVTVKPGYTGHKKFVWAGQKKIRYKESSGILIIPALIQIIPAQFC
jgi:hypothetical protein